MLVDMDSLQVPGVCHPLPAFPVLEARFLYARDKACQAAARLAATFLTRPDTKEEILPAFLEW